MTQQGLGATRGKAGKYLTFRLGNEVFGLEILKVQEIIGIMKVTHVPRTPRFVRGVINLRGKVFPVVDLRLKFDLEAVQDTDRTCIIVLQVSRTDHLLTMGIVVDAVSEVLDISAGQIEPPPEFGTSVNTSFILGLGKSGDKVIILLDVDRVLTGEEAASVDSVAGSAAQGVPA